MADIGSESLKNLQALEAELARVQGQVSTLAGMVERATAQAAVAERAAPAGAARAAGAVAAGGEGAATTETAARGRLGGMLDEEAARRSQLQAVLGRGVAAENGLTAALEREIQVSAAATNELQARGALTTEFIVAAQRGQVTLGELGTQAGLVAAKFGGWAVAAAGVYGLFDAIKKVGEGAIETQSGVGQLSRFFNVDPQQAGAGFRNVSEQLNVPVGDVAQAQAQFARLYHDQTGSLTAARTALTATKLDNLSTADSYRYLTAAAQGFRLEASQLPNLLAMVNAEQRDLGAKVSDTLPSVAKAAGAWKNAGGSLSDLIAVIATGQRATGQGSAVGTALQRYVGRQLQMPSAQATIAGFGIDPHQDPGTILREAIAKSQSLPGDQVQKLANALGGTKYGPRIFAPLLRQQDLFSRAQQSVTAPGNLKDLSSEVAKVVGTSREGIKSIENALGRLGSTLASSGLLSFGGTLLHGLTGVLNAANTLLGVFTDLPKPIQHLTSDMIALYAVMRAAQRFNIGGPVGGLLGTTGDRRIGTQVAIGQQNIREQLADEMTRVSGQVIPARLRAQAASGREQAFAEQIARQGGTPTGEQSAYLSTLTQRRVVTEERLNTLLAEQTEIQVAINNASAQEVAYREATGTNLERAQAAGYAYVPATVERGTGEAPLAVGASMMPQADEEITRQARAGKLSLLPAPVAGGQADSVIAAQARTGKLAMFGETVAGGGLDTAGLKGGAAALKSAALGLPERLGGAVENAFRGIAGTFFGGPQGLLTGGLLAYQLGEALKPVIGQLGFKAGYNSDEVGRATAAAQARATQVQQQIALGQLPSLTTRQSGAPRIDLNAPPLESSTWLRALAPLSPQFSGGKLTVDTSKVPSLQTPGQLAFNTRVLTGEKAAPDLNTGQINTVIGNVQSDYDKGVLTYKQAQRRLANALADVAHTNIDPKDQSALRENIQAAQSAIDQQAATRTTDPKSLYNILNAMPSKGAQGAGGLSDWVKANQDLIQGAVDEGDGLTGLGGKLQGAQIALKIATARVRGALNSGQAPSPNDVTALKDAESALKDLYSGITQQADDAATLAHGNLGQIQAAFGRAISQVQQSGGARTQQGRLEIQTLQDKQYTAVTGVLDAQTDIANALDVNPVNDAERDINRIGQELTTAIATYGYNSKQVADLIKQRQSDYKNIAQYNVSLVQAQGAVAEAQAITPTQQAQAALSTALGVYNAAKASGQYNQAELTKLWADVLKAKVDVGEQQLQTANDTAKANADLAESRTTDPVRQAYIAWQAALQQRADPRKPGDAQEKLAQANKAHQDYVDKWFSQQMDNIDFATKTLKQSDSQAADRYLKLSKDMQLSAQERRQAYLKYFDLIQGAASQSPTESELDLGKIKLPTAYEIRSRMLQRGGGQYGQVHMTNAPNITVYVNSSGDATEVFNALDQALGTSVKSAVRAAGG